MSNITTRAGKGSPLTNNELDANFTNLNSDKVEIGGDLSGTSSAPNVAKIQGRAVSTDAPAAGEKLVWNGTAWEPSTEPTGEPIGHADKTQSSISFNSGTRTFTIAPVATEFVVWCKGVKYTYTSAQTVVIPNTTGLHFIYFNQSGVLSTQMSYFTWEDHAPTAYVYWNATTSTAVYFGDERHGITLDWQTHEYLHRTRGAAIANGFGASGYTTTGLGATDADAQIDIGGGTFFDEDMQVDIVSTNSPVANTWQQDLSGPARIPVLYLSGNAWVIDAPTDFPFKVVGGIPQYNLYSGGTWSTASVSNNEYFVSWILATNNLNYPVVSIISQAPTNQLSQAEAMTFEGLSLSGFPSVEFRPLYKVIYTHKTGFANSVKASTVAVYDLRSLQSAGVAAALVQDHGNLSGLGDDDHAQYLHVSEVRTPSSAVKNSLLPSQTSNSGKYLSTDGTNPSWVAIPSGSLDFTGDVTGTGTTGSPVALTLANSGVTAGAYSKVTVDGKGRVTVGTNIASSDVTTALGFTPENAANKGVANGYAGLDSSGKIASSHLPSYVDDVLEYANLAAFPATGDSGKIYIAIDSAKVYRWSGSAYVEISASPGSTDAVPEGSTNLYHTTSRVRTSISASGSLSYNNTTGIFSYTTPNSDGITEGSTNLYFTNARARSAVSATGSLSYNSSTGVFSYTQPTNVSTFTNDSGYLTGITGAQVTTALGYTPANSTSLSSYLPLSGGTMTGSTEIASGQNVRFGHANQSDGNDGKIGANLFASGLNIVGTQTTAGGGRIIRYWGTLLTSGGDPVLHSGNYNSYSPSLTGSGASGTWGISITGSSASTTGNAATATNISNSGTVTLATATEANSIYVTAPSYTTDTPVKLLNFDWYGNLFSLGNIRSGATPSNGFGVYYTASGGSRTEIARFGTGGTFNAIGAITQNGSQVLHAANFTNYAVPLTNGTASNLTIGVRVNSASYGGNTSGLSGYSFPAEVRASASKPALTWHYESVATRHIALESSGALNVLNPGEAGGAVFQVGGNTVLHAGNYTSYSPSLTGSGASGTWGISINGAAPWGSVSGRPGWLSGGSYIETQSDANSQVNSGFYENAGGGSNWPSATWYNSINIRHSNQGNYHGFQIAMSYYDNNFWFRSYQGNGTFQSWARAISTANYADFSYPKLSATRYANTDFNSLGNEANGFRAYSNYIPSGGSYNQPPNGAGDYRVYQLSSPETAGNWGGQIVQNFYDDRMWFRRQQGSVWQSWREFIHDGNYGSYALPLSGGTVSGVVRINNQLQVGQNTNGTAWIDAYGGYAWFGRDSNTTGVRIDGSGNVHTTAALNSVGALTQNGNQVLHAGNYTSYSPSLTGSGASGTWGINITGNAGSVGGRAASYFYPNVTDNGYATGDIAGTTAHQRLWGTDSVQNMFAFNPPTEVEYSTNGSTWTATTCPADVWDGKVYGKWGGMGMSVGNNIGGWRYVRMTWRNFGYRFFSHFTLAHTTNGHSFNFVFYKSDLSGNFGGEAFRMNNIGSWPGYTFVKHENVSGWWDTRDIRIVFELNHNNDYANNAIAVGHIGLMGSYGGFQRLYDWNSDRSMYFKNAYITDSSHQVLHAGNYSSYALPLSGGTVEGTANVRTSVIKQYQYVRHIEGKNWDTYDTSASGLYLQYASNQPVYIGSASNVALHSGNYSSYSPTLTGGGASGTWGINITGNAASVTNGVTSGNVASFAIPASTNFGSGDLNQAYNSGLYGFDVPSNSPGFSYGHILVLRGRGDTIGQLAIDYSTGQASFRGGYLPNGSSTVGAVWSSWRRAIDSANYSSYALPLSGGVNMTGSFGLNDSRLYLRTNGDTNHYLWNSDDDWEEMVAYSGTGFRVKSSNGSTLSTFTTSGVYLNALRTDRAEASNGTFMWRVGANSGTTRHINLSDSDTDPSAASINTGITWGARTDSQPYYMIYCKSQYDNGYSNHTRLTLAWHTGIEIGASPTYGGTRFFNNSPFVGSEIMSIGKGDSHVRVNNNLYVGGNLALHAGNYNSYALPLSGGNISGAINLTSYNNGLLVNASGTSSSGGSIAIQQVTGEGWTGIFADYEPYTGWGLWHDNPNNYFCFTAEASGGGLRSFTVPSRVSGGRTAYEKVRIEQGSGDVRIGGNLYITTSGHLALHAGNYTSYTGGLSSTNNWGGVNYFVANRNTTSDSPPLQAFSNNASGAIMSFHRGGYYAVNFGLDSDNVMRIGGWSAAANRWQLDMSGNGTYAGNVTAYSDERLKKDWSPIYDGFVDRLAVIRAGTYTRIDSGHRQAGVSAQAMRELLPEVVSEDNEGTLALAYGNAAMVSAVELAKELVQLKRELAELKSKLH